MTSPTTRASVAAENLRYLCHDLYSPVSGPDAYRILSDLTHVAHYVERLTSQLSASLLAASRSGALGVDPLPSSYSDPIEAALVNLEVAERAAARLHMPLDRAAQAASHFTERVTA